jgi:hypothetical protein
LTSIDVSTNRGIFNLALEQRDFYASSVPKDSTQFASTVHNWLYKTRLCTHHSNGKVCYSGTSCSFAHGDSELRTKEHRTKREFTHASHASVPSSVEPTTDNEQTGVDSGDVIDPDLMATDEVQPGDCTIIEPTSGSVVVNSEVSNSIIGGGNLVPGSLSESVNSSSSITSAIAINAVESLHGGKLSVPEVTTTPTAMFMGGFVEKNAASTSVNDINTPTNLNATTSRSPSGLKLSKSEIKRAKRAASSPLEGAITKTCTTGLAADTLFAVPEYDIDFPISPIHTVSTQKGVTKEKGIPKSTPVTTPAFALNGKPVPCASATGAFTYEVPKPPPIVKSGRVKKDTWSTVRVNNVFTTPVGTSVKSGKTTSASTTASPTIADVGSTTKGSVSPSTTDLKATINVQTTSPLKQPITPKPTGVNFRKQTGNKFQALSDSANCNEDVSAQ